MSSKLNLYSLILCGGQSRRMGTDKASLQYKGNSLLLHTTHLLKDAGINTVFSVGGDSHDIQDTKQFQGPGFATINAIQHVEHNTSTHFDGVVVLPVDMPLMQPHIIKQLIACSNKTNESGFFDFHPFPFIIRDPGAKIPKLTPLLAGKPPSIRAVLKAIGGVFFEVPSHSDTLFINVNEPQQWEKITSGPLA